MEKIVSFHLNQSISYIEENNYEYGLSQGEYQIIKYNDMIIYLDGEVFKYNDSTYYLIIFKETKIYQDNKKDFDRLINSIKFVEG